MTKLYDEIKYYIPKLSLGMSRLSDKKLDYFPTSEKLKKRCQY